jgi:undecaprenyl-diphosphatase
VTVAAVVLTGFLVGLLAYWIRRGAPFVSVDESVERWADGAASGTSDAVLRAVTQLGATVTLIVVGVGLALWARLRRGNWAATAFLTVVLAGQSLIANLIKLGVARVRPAVHPRASFSGASFPSGHATAAAAAFLAFSLVLAYGRGPRARAAMMSIAVGLAVAVAWSRVLLGVHWFSDVVAGLAIGWTWYGVCAVVFGGRLMRYGVPAEVAEATPPPAGRFAG